MNSHADERCWMCVDLCLGLGWILGLGLQVPGLNFSELVFKPAFKITNNMLGGFLIMIMDSIPQIPIPIIKALTVICWGGSLL